MEMKEMVYYPMRLANSALILYEGKYKGFNFLILNYGTHPCAYVEIPTKNKLYCRKYEDTKLLSISVHGGITFSDYLDRNSKKENLWYIGWDYAHFSDFNPLFKEFERRLGNNIIDGKKWTTQEIFEDVKSVICQIKYGKFIYNICLKFKKLARQIKNLFGGKNNEAHDAKAKNKN